MISEPGVPFPAGGYALIACCVLGPGVPACVGGGLSYSCCVFCSVATYGKGNQDFKRAPSQARAAAACIGSPWMGAGGGLSYGSGDCSGVSRHATYYDAGGIYDVTVGRHRPQRLQHARQLRVQPGGEVGGRNERRVCFDDGHWQREGFPGCCCYRRSEVRQEVCNVCR